jgi:hypothetical protein
MTIQTDIEIVVHDASGAEVMRRGFSQPRVRIGRVRQGPDGPNDLVLPDDAVSRDHAHLVVDGAAITVVDRQSRNCTFVNSQAVQERRLQPSDTLEIGPYLLRCTAAAPAALAPEDPELPVFDLRPDEPDEPGDLEVPGDPPPGAPTPTRTPLAAAYRALAGRHGAAAWGRPPALVAADWPRVLAAARALVDDPLWPEWLARELCDTGPLAALLDDPGVTAITVAGAGPIQVRRGDEREAASARFSCPEAVAACFERWTGAALPDDEAVEAHPAAGVQVVALGRRLAPGGPVLHVVRGGPAPARGLAELALPPAAAQLLADALRRGLGVVVHGERGPLAAVAAALAAGAPEGAVTAVVARSGTWPRGQAIVLAGERPGAVALARRLHPDLLVVEEVEPRDAPELRAAARGRGLLLTVPARTGEAALLRLAAMVAVDAAADPARCRAALALDLDLFVGVHAPGGRPGVAAIAELREGGDLAPLFAATDDGALEPTGVAPHTLRERPRP